MDNDIVLLLRNSMTIFFILFLLPSTGLFICCNDYDNVLSCYLSSQLNNLSYNLRLTYLLITQRCSTFPFIYLLFVIYILSIGDRFNVTVHDVFNVCAMLYDYMERTNLLSFGCCFVFSSRSLIVAF